MSTCPDCRKHGRGRPCVAHRLALLRESAQLLTRGHVCDRAAIKNGRRTCWQCHLQSRLGKATKP